MDLHFSRPFKEATSVLDAFKIPWRCDSERFTSEQHVPPSEIYVNDPPPPQEGWLTFLDLGWSINTLWGHLLSTPFFSGERHWYWSAQWFGRTEDTPRFRQLCLHPQVRGADHMVPHTRVIVMGAVVHWLLTQELAFREPVRGCDGWAFGLIGRDGRYDFVRDYGAPPAACR
jgi:hypothetical protein